MFRRQNNRQGQNIQNNRDPRNIFNDEEEPGRIGNEALAENIAGGLIGLISNEANNEAMGNDIPQEITENRLEHYYQNDLNNLTRDERNDRPKHYYENDLNNLKMKPSGKSRRRKKAGNDLPLIPVDDDPIKIPDITTGKPKKPRAGGMTEKELPDEADEKLIIEKAPEIIENILEKAPGLDASLSDKNSGSKKNKKGKKSSSKKSASKNAAPKGAAPQREEDLTQIDQSLVPIQGWDYASERVPAEKLPARKKQGFGSKILSALPSMAGRPSGRSAASLQRSAKRSMTGSDPGHPVPAEGPGSAYLGSKGFSSGETAISSPDGTVRNLKTRKRILTRSRPISAGSRRSGPGRPQTTPLREMKKTETRSRVTQSFRFT